VNEKKKTKGQMTRGQLPRNLAMDVHIRKENEFGLNFFTLEPSIPNWNSLIPRARRNSRLASGYGSGHRYLAGGRKIKTTSCTATSTKRRYVDG
jgi:hypothetical protein